MNDAHSILGRDDSDLSQFRWYVYSNECARWLNDALFQPHQTEIRNAFHEALIQTECAPILMINSMQ